MIRFANGITDNVKDSFEILRGKSLLDDYVDGCTEMFGYGLELNYHLAHPFVFNALTRQIPNSASFIPLRLCFVSNIDRK